MLFLNIRQYLSDISYDDLNFQIQNYEIKKELEL